MKIEEKRFDAVRRMNDIMISLNDEDLIEPWLECGVPDGANDDDYWWFADDEVEFMDLLKLFLKISKKAMKESGAIV